MNHLSKMVDRANWSNRVIDLLTIGLCLLGPFTVFQLAVNKANQQISSQTFNTPQAPQANRFVTHRTSLKNEKEGWDSFSAWYQTEQPISGSCHFTLHPFEQTIHQTLYTVQCSGLAYLNPGQQADAPVWPTEHLVFYTPKRKSVKKRVRKVTPQPPTKPQKPQPSTGTFELNGQKLRFDESSQSWRAVD